MPRLLALFIATTLLALAGCVTEQTTNDPDPMIPLGMEVVACQSAGVAWLVDGEAAQEAAGPHWTVSRNAAGLANLYILNLECPTAQYSGVAAPPERFVYLGLSGSFTDPSEATTDSAYFALQVIAAEGTAVKAFFEDVGITTVAGTGSWQATTAPLDQGIVVTWNVETDTGSAGGEYVLAGTPQDGGAETITLTGRPIAEGPLPRLVGDDRNVALSQLGPSHAMFEGDTWWSRLDASPAPTAAWLVTNATFDVTLVA